MKWTTMQIDEDGKTPMPTEIDLVQRLQAVRKRVKVEGNQFTIASSGGGTPRLIFILRHGKEGDLSQADIITEDRDGFPDGGWDAHSDYSG